MSYYRICPHCGAHLDPGEVCNCRGADLTADEKRLITAYRNGKAAEVVNLLKVQGDLPASFPARPAAQEKTAVSATNADDGKVEHVDHAVSTSNNT